jgi:glycine reductase
MRDALPKMAAITKKLVTEETLGLPKEEGYLAQGRRVTIFAEKRGSKRAVDMLLKRLNNEDFETELPMPEFDSVEVADSVELSEATIALVTTGGIVPVGNPDRIESASASKYGVYSLAEIDDFVAGEYETIHGGFDPVYANEDCDRVIPLDILKEKEETGVIGQVHDKFYTTTGTGTAVANSEKFGKEMGKELKEDGVDAVILTST